MDSNDSWTEEEDDYEYVAPKKRKLSTFIWMNN